jgi:hypothetical protein
MDSACKPLLNAWLCDHEAGHRLQPCIRPVDEQPHLAWATLDIMKVAGAEPIKNKASQWAMDTIGFAAPATDPLDHECNRIKCSLR